jgi:diacylglycerol kinase (ATP)
MIAGVRNILAKRSFQRIDAKCCRLNPMLQIILNPTAGGGRASRAIPKLQAALEARKLEYKLFLTDKAGAARDYTRRLSGNDPIVVVGGDGTLHEVIGSLLEFTDHATRSVGVIPLGTGDDFARGAKIPLTDLEAALDVVANGKTRVFDAGRIGSKAFLNGFGSGFDAQVAREVKNTPSFLPGSMRYLWAILAELSKLAPRPARVIADGAVVHDGASLLIAVMSLIGYGGGLKIAPNSDPQDGLLELVIAGSFNTFGVLGILSKLQNGTHLGHEQVHVFRAKEIRIEWQDPTAAHVDGELLEKNRVFEARVLPGAVSVFVP